VTSSTWEDLPCILWLLLVREVKQERVSLARSRSILLVREERIWHEQRHRRKVLEEKVVDVAIVRRGRVVSDAHAAFHMTTRYSRSCSKRDADGKDHRADVEECRDTVVRSFRVGEIVEARPDVDDKNRFGKLEDGSGSVPSPYRR
jgi:hypothetical protein